MLFTPQIFFLIEHLRSTRACGVYSLKLCFAGHDLEPGKSWKRVICQMKGSSSQVQTSPHFTLATSTKYFHVGSSLVKQMLNSEF